ncbi:uncharacterized protein [Euphorbia lathyris]|uniref:uncharacterized protein isoform X2 n=1 Tax=Euphorbia lathyris TaxID=212925 RepID=UPI00331361E9
MTSIVSTHHRNWSLGFHHPHHQQQHRLLFRGRFNDKVSRFGDSSAPFLLFRGYRLLPRKFSPVLSAKVNDPDESESESQDEDEDENEATDKNSSNDPAGGVNSEILRRNLERIVGVDDSSFSGIDLATLIRNKYGRSYDVQLIKKEFMGRNLLALNVMWKYREQRSFPLTEEEYLLRLDDVANTLKCWGAVSHIRNSLAKSKERPRIGKAVSIFIDMDETGGRANEWIYK